MPTAPSCAGSFSDGKLVMAKRHQGRALVRSGQRRRLAGIDPAARRAHHSARVSGKTLIGVDGSSIALTLIEGGMELQVVPADGTAKKTTFTFMTDRMGTVVEDSGSPSAGSSPSPGFFRLTGKGVEVRYADGRSAMLSARSGRRRADGAGRRRRPVLPRLVSAGPPFSDSEKKIALNAYATRLGLPVTASETGNGCSTSARAASRTCGARPSQPHLPFRAGAKTRPERRSQAKAPPARRKPPTASATISRRRQPKAGPELSGQAIGNPPLMATAIAVPSVSGAMAMTPPPPPCRPTAMTPRIA